VNEYPMDEPAWQELLPEPAPLTELVICGSGKDLGLEFTLADGRRMEMGAGAVSRPGADGKTAAAGGHQLA
jgi:hypothetical protein